MTQLITTLIYPPTIVVLDSLGHLRSLLTAVAHGGIIGLATQHVVFQRL